MTTVLVVEDNEDLLLLAQAFLEESYEVLTAENSEQALEALKSNYVDLLFTDIMMPGAMNGVALALYTRAHYEKIGILLTTGQGYDHPARQNGFPVLPKPYRKAQLMEGLITVLQSTRCK